MTNIKDKISQHNLQAYMDVAKDMLEKQRGVFTFVVRVDGKKIVDYVQYESINYGRKDDRTKDN